MSEKSMFLLILVLVLWTIPWKGLALWRAARKGDKIWFIILLVINTLAILEIIYLLFFSQKEKHVKKNETQREMRQEKKEITVINPKRFL
jgi:methionyl-tRNA synthetase